MNAALPLRRTALARRTTGGIAIALLAACTLGGFGSDAWARDRHAVITGSQGQTATRDVSRAQGDVASSSTGFRGRTRSRDVDRSAGGTQATLTGANGQTVNRVTTRNETGSTTTVEGSQGRSGAVTVSR